MKFIRMKLTSNLSAKALATAALLLFMPHLSHAQIEIVNEHPKSAAIKSSSTQIQAALRLQGFFDVYGGLNHIPSFNLPSIDVYTDATGNAFSMTAKLSKLTILNTTVLANGKSVFTHLEGDFNGALGSPTSGAFRLRYAYVKYGAWTIGQELSGFGDRDAGVNTLDPDGPSLGLGLRKPVIRYTFNETEVLSGDVSLEQPIMDCAIGLKLPKGAKQSIAETLRKLTVQEVTQYMPEVAGGVTYKFGNAEAMNHVRVAGLIRHLAYGHIEKPETDHALSWGASVSSKITLCPSASLVAQLSGGRGIATYTSSFSGGGYDGFITNNNIKTLPTYGGLLAVELEPVKGFPVTSTIAIGYSRFDVKADNVNELALTGYYGSRLPAFANVSKTDTSQQANLGYNKLNIDVPYLSINAIYQVVRNFSLGAEVNWGQKTLTTSGPALTTHKDTKDALRFTFCVQYKI